MSPTSDAVTLALTLRTKTWFPSKVNQGSRDYRELGVAVFGLTMKAEGASGEPLDVLGAE
jgi:hypothetical protein